MATTRTQFARIILTEDEKAQLDDGQGWYKPGDTVHLGGYLPASDDDNPALQLGVGSVSHDNWAWWAELPEAIRARLRAEA
jgi:hypothetical protein